MINLWPFRKKNKDNDILIKDGQIVDADKSFIEPEQSLEQEPLQETGKFYKEEYQFYPPLNPIFNPSFLCDDQAVSDLGLYLSFLESEGKKERTRSEYMIDLRVWKKEINGHFPNAVLVQQVLDRFKPHRAHRLLTVLKSYGKYRNYHGDPRIVVLLSTSLNIKKPEIPESKPEILSKEQFHLYNLSARELCKENNHTGIWIGLSLLGIRSDTIKYVDTDDQQHLVIKNGEEKKINAPAWLVNAIETIPKSKWERSRNTIRKGLQNYGITPNVLCLSAAHYANNGNSR